MSSDVGVRLSLAEAQNLYAIGHVGLKSLRTVGVLTDSGMESAKCGLDKLGEALDAAIDGEDALERK